MRVGRNYWSAEGPSDHKPFMQRRGDRACGPHLATRVVPPTCNPWGHRWEVMQGAGLSPSARLAITGGIADAKIQHFFHSASPFCSSRVLYPYISTLYPSMSVIAARGWQQTSRPNPCPPQCLLDYYISSLYKKERGNQIATLQKIRGCKMKVRRCVMNSRFAAPKIEI